MAQGTLKPKRETNSDLLEFVRTLPCIACGLPGPSEAHHVTTRGAGGGDVWNNLMSLCGPHHREWHVNPGKFIRKHISTWHWLDQGGRHDVLERYGLLEYPRTQWGPGHVSKSRQPRQP